MSGRELFDGDAALGQPGDAPHRAGYRMEDLREAGKHVVGSQEIGRLIVEALAAECSRTGFGDGLLLARVLPGKSETNAPESPRTRGADGVDIIHTGDLRIVPRAPVPVQDQSVINLPLRSARNEEAGRPDIPGRIRRDAHNYLVLPHPGK